MNKNVREQPASAGTTSAATHGNESEKLLLDALEKARQTVKPLVKKALQAEDVPNDLLSFRLKRPRDER